MDIGLFRRTATAAAVVALFLTAPGVGTAFSSSSTQAGDDSRVLRVATDDAAGTPLWEPAGLRDQPARGEVHEGLADSRGCKGGYAVEDPGVHDHSAHSHAASDGFTAPRCSHGPDAAPAGVDVRDRPTMAELRDRARDQAVGEPTAGEPVASDPTAGEAGSGIVPCYGDGTSGKRFQAIYAVAADRLDRFDAAAPLIEGYAATADRAFAASAARDGGVRHLRWVTDTDCRLSILHVVLSPTGDDSLGNTRAELRSLGLIRTDRKYVVWADADTYCGIAYVVGDSRPDASNPANGGGTFSRIDTACWGYSGSVEAHEIAHMIGGVQLEAPNSNGAWHCTDESDRLCYDDGSGASLNYLCGSSAEPLLDCNGDDYFNVAPREGSWLSTHWNLATSQYLEVVEPIGTSTVDPPPPTVPPAVDSPTVDPPTVDPPTVDPPTVDPAVLPTPPSPPRRDVASWRESTPRGSWVGRFRVRAAAGRLVARVELPGSGRVLVRVRDGDGRVLVTRYRRSEGRAVALVVPAGRYVVVVRGTRARAGRWLGLRVSRLVL